MANVKTYHEVGVYKNFVDKVLYRLDISNYYVMSFKLPDDEYWRIHFNEYAKHAKK